MDWSEHHGTNELSHYTWRLSRCTGHAACTLHMHMCSAGSAGNGKALPAPYLDGLNGPLNESIMLHRINRGLLFADNYTARCLEQRGLY